MTKTKGVAKVDKELFWSYETCKCCTREQRLAWFVLDGLWDRVVIDYYKDKVLCLECFLRMADDRNIKLSLGDIWFQAVITRDKESE